MFIYHNYSCKTMWPGIAKEKVAQSSEEENFKEYTKLV